MGNAQSAIQEQFNLHKCQPMASSQSAAIAPESAKSK
jgi:hypothetical protein